jgi:Co/Zn/Cd efflux system component
VQQQAKERVQAPTHDQEFRDGRFAIRLSLLFGLVMLIGKTAAYFMTHSAAIFSDAAESVIHVIAVGFASFQPAAQHQTCFLRVPLRLRADHLLLRWI